MPLLYHCFYQTIPCSQFRKRKTKLPIRKRIKSPWKFNSKLTCWAQKCGIYSDPIGNTGFWFKFRLVYFRGFSWQYATIGSVDSSAPNKHETSDGANGDSTYWRIHALSGHNELNLGCLTMEVDSVSPLHGIIQPIKTSIHLLSQEAECFQNIWPHPWNKNSQ